MSTSFPARQDGKAVQVDKRTRAKGEAHRSMGNLGDGKNLSRGQGEGQGRRWERQPRAPELWCSIGACGSCGGTVAGSEVPFGQHTLAAVWRWLGRSTGSGVEMHEAVALLQSRDRGGLGSGTTVGVERSGQ